MELRSPVSRSIGLDVHGDFCEVMHRNPGILHDDLGAFAYDRIRRRPMVLPAVVEV